MNGDFFSEFFSQLWVQLLISIIANPISYFLGLITKKSVGRKLQYYKKWLLNDILTMNLLVIKEYTHTNLNDIDISLFSQIKEKLSDITLIQHSSNTMIINVSPIFNNVIIRKEDTTTFIDNDDDYPPLIKLSISTENTVRIGIREIKDQLIEFEKYVNIIFDTMHNQLFEQKSLPRQSFAECDIQRSVILVEKKEIKIIDKKLNAEINGDDERLTIISPIDKIATATKKYHFV